MKSRPMKMTEDQMRTVILNFEDYFHRSAKEIQRLKRLLVQHALKDGKCNECELTWKHAAECKVGQALE
jgi:predicted RNA-binding protein Jag